MKSFLTFLTALLSCTVMFAQNVTYTYDNLGNRNTRTGTGGGNNLSASPTDFSNVPATGGNQTINVTSNTSWSVTNNGNAWIQLSATSGSNDGSFQITVAANTGSARSGSVTVTASGVSPVTISVSQLAVGGGSGGCVVNKVRLVFRNDCCQDRLNGAKIQGSNDGSSWNDLYTINVNGTGSWQEFTFSNTAAYTSVRFQAGPNGNGELVELEFYNNNTKLNGTTFATGGTWSNNTSMYGYQNAFDGNASGNMWHAASMGSGATAGLSLSGCGGCTPPSAPTLSANPSSINSGQNSTLTATNCSGTVNWSTGATGSSITVSPGSTTTYTATCTAGGCTSSSGSVTVTVNTGSSGGCVVNKVRLVFRNDCCQDRLNGAKIQGSNNGSSWNDLYTINVNGTGSWQEFTFSNTAAYTSVRFQSGPNGNGELVELEFYNNNTKLNGTVFATGGTYSNNTSMYGYQNAFDGNASGNMWHAASMGSSATAGLTLSGCGGCTPPSAPTLSANPGSINSGQSSQLTATNCSGTVNWSTGATGSSIMVSPGSTATYTATCTAGGCTSSSGSVTVTVNTGGGGCVVNKVRLVFRNDCCQDRLNGAKIQGFNDGSSWNDLYTINANGTGSWQEFTFGNTAAYTSVRFQAGPNGNGELIELEFYNDNTKLNGTAFATGGTYSNNTSMYGYQNAFDGNASGNMWHAASMGSNATAGLSLSGCGGCTPPSAPTLSANPGSINSGQSSTLTASNCSGTVNWSTGATGSSITVSPGSTTTYTATCTAGGCTSGSSSVTVTVGGGGTLNQCLEAESSSGNGSITSDPNASGGQTRGLESNSNHYVDYVVTNVPSAGTYYAKLRYYSSSAPVVSVQVNGGSATGVNLNHSGSWNIAWTEQIIPVSLNAGTNTIRIQGTGGGSCRQDRLCVSNSSARLGSVEERPTAEVEDETLLRLYPNPSDGKITLRYYLEKGKEASLHFMTVGGSVLLHKTLTGAGGWQEDRTDLSNQPDGTYLLRFEDDRRSLTRKFVIVK